MYYTHYLIRFTIYFKNKFVGLEIMFGKKEIFIHILCWVILLVLLYYAYGQVFRVVEIDGELVYYTKYIPFMFLLLFINVIGKAILFYTNLLYLIPKYFSKKLYNKYALSVFAVFTITLTGTLLTASYTILAFDFNLNHVTYYIPFIVILHVLIIPISIAFGYTKEKIELEKLSKVLMEEKLKTELNYLKYQINPHFLFNTLNNIYAMTLKHKDEVASNSVSQLARMMRYMLHESNVEKISLERELNYIKDFIALEKLRLDKNENIKIKVTYDLKNKNVLIAPMILIPLVENAFKHGISYTKPSKIDIKIICDSNNFLKINVKNTDHSTKKSIKTSGTGIGLKNLESRLNLIYPNQYQLSAKKENLMFLSKLTLNLKNDE